MLQASGNTIYYTLSTIAQSMAATFALISAFILYKIQGQSSKLDQLFKNIELDTAMMKQFEHARLLSRSHKYKEAINDLQTVDIRNKSIKSMVDEITKEINDLKYFKQTLIGMVYPSVGLIAISTFGLVFTDSIQTWQSNIVLLCFLTLTFSAILISIAIVIHKILANL